jgi:hypothetical protein
MTGMATYTGACSDAMENLSTIKLEQSIPERPSAASAYCEGDTGQVVG